MPCGTYACKCLTSAYRVTNPPATITVRITAEQRHFLASQSVGFRKISDVVRDLIDQAMAQPLNPIDTPCTLGGPTQEGLPSTFNSTVVIDYSLDSNSSSNSKIDISRKCNDATDETPKPAGRGRRSGGATGTRVRPDYPETFGLFWRQYLAIENRASSQSKPRALAAWVGVTKHVDPLSLQQCLTAAVDEQRRIVRRGGFASPFPDAFRWLRDGRWEAFLASDTQQPLEAPSRAFQGPLPSDPF